MSDLPDSTESEQSVPTTNECEKCDEMFDCSSFVLCDNFNKINLFDFS